MREIKFRAWDKEDNKIKEVLSISFVYQEAIVKEGMVSMKAKKFENVDLMQYTGLKDKNGKEIYEGDILESKQKLQEGIVSVVFDEGAFWFMWDKNNGFTYEWLVRQQGEDFSFEVIGNIYENPEMVQ